MCQLFWDMHGNYARAAVTALILTSIHNNRGPTETRLYCPCCCLLHFILIFLNGFVDAFIRMNYNINRRNTSDIQIFRVVPFAIMTSVD